MSRSLSSADNVPLGVKTRCLYFGVFIDDLSNYSTRF